MEDQIKSYYLRLSAEMSRELRHRSVETGRTMNSEIVQAIRLYLDSLKAPAAEQPATDDAP
jgi:predicted DNA-binding protein